MSNADTIAVVVEREIPWPPEKIWRALTQPVLIEAWLMKNDFQPVVGHAFQLSADWGSVQCRVLELEPNRSLTYSWATMGVETVVTFTLTPTSTGARLRVEQAGFSSAPDHQRYIQGAQFGWANFLSKLEQVLDERA